MVKGLPKLAFRSNQIDDCPYLLLRASNQYVMKSNADIHREALATASGVQVKRGWR